MPVFMPAPAFDTQGDTPAWALPVEAEAPEAPVEPVLPFEGETAPQTMPQV